MIVSYRRLMWLVSQISKHLFSLCVCVHGVSKQLSTIAGVMEMAPGRVKPPTIPSGLCSNVSASSIYLPCCYNSREHSWKKPLFKSSCSLRKLVNTEPMLNWAYESLPPLAWIVNCFCPSHCQVLALAITSGASCESQIHCHYLACYWEKTDSWKLGGDCLDIYGRYLRYLLTTLWVSWVYLVSQQQGWRVEGIR